MKKSLPRALIAIMLLMVFGVASAQVALKDGHPDTYYVKDGDTLWGIASKFLDNPWQWPELWYDNGQISNPHLIYPGDVIHLRYVQGKPHLVVEHGEQGKMAQAGGVVKLSPHAREVPLDTAIPAISLESIQPFLKEALVLTKQDIASAPYIVGGEENHVVYGRGDKVYARDPVNKWKNLVQSYGFYRVGEQYVDPNTREVLGYEALQVGRGQVSDHDGQIITMRVTRSNEDLRQGDRVFSSRARKLQSTFYPSAPKKKINAQIIRFFGAVNSVARNDVVVIDRGEREGLKEGNVLNVYQPGDVVKDHVKDQLVKLPKVKAGTVLLFRVFEKVSYGLVLESSRPINKNDLVSNPPGSLPSDL